MKKGWTLRETLIIVLILLILTLTILPQYVKTVKRAAASEAVRTIVLLKEALANYYMQNGVFSLNPDELGISRLNNSSKADFKYHIIGTDIDKYEIVADGRESTVAKGIRVVYHVKGNVYKIEYLGKPINVSNKQ